MNFIMMVIGWVVVSAISLSFICSGFVWLIQYLTDYDKHCRKINLLLSEASDLHERIDDTLELIRDNKKESQDTDIEFADNNYHITEPVTVEPLVTKPSEWNKRAEATTKEPNGSSVTALLDEAKEMITGVHCNHTKTCRGCGNEKGDECSFVLKRKVWLSKYEAVREGK